MNDLSFFASNKFSVAVSLGEVFILFRICNGKIEYLLTSAFELSSYFASVSSLFFGYTEFLINTTLLVFEIDCTSSCRFLFC